MKPRSLSVVVALSVVASLFLSTGLLAPVAPARAAATTHLMAEEGDWLSAVGTGIAGLAAIWGGVDAILTQEFGPTDFTVNVHPDWYAYSLEYGFPQPGHTGLDVAIPLGTPLYMPVDAVVYCAGTFNSGFPDEESCAAFARDGGGPTSGRLQVQLANGDMLILGHVIDTVVAPGARVAAGTMVGHSGGGLEAADSVHIEYRTPDPTIATGWRIIDPRLTPLNGAGMSPADATPAAGANCGSAAFDARWEPVRQWLPDLLAAQEQVNTELGVLVPANVIMAVMMIETQGIMPDGQNAAGAVGLFQIPPSTLGAEHYDFARGATDPAYSIYIGVYELALRYLDSAHFNPGNPGQPLPWEHVIVGFFSGHYFPNGADDGFNSDFEYQRAFKNAFNELEANDACGAPVAVTATATVKATATPATPPREFSFRGEFYLRDRVVPVEHDELIEVTAYQSFIVYGRTTDAPFAALYIPVSKRVKDGVVRYLPEQVNHPENPCPAEDPRITIPSPWTLADGSSYVFAGYEPDVTGKLMTRLADTVFYETGSSQPLQELLVKVEDGYQRYLYVESEATTPVVQLGDGLAFAGQPLTYRKTLESATGLGPLVRIGCAGPFKVSAALGAEDPPFSRVYIEVGGRLFVFDADAATS